MYGTVLSKQVKHKFRWKIHLPTRKNRSAPILSFSNRDLGGGRGWGSLCTINAKFSVCVTGKGGQAIDADRGRVGVRQRRSYLWTWRELMQTTALQRVTVYYRAGKWRHVLHTSSVSEINKTEDWLLLRPSKIQKTDKELRHTGCHARYGIILSTYVLYSRWSTLCDQTACVPRLGQMHSAAMQCLSQLGMLST